MPIKTFDSSESAADTEFQTFVAPKESSTVLKPFNGPTRRFAVDYVVIDADIPDLPMSLDDLRAGGFIS